jgi:uncharacterized membrane protein YozB (DUF420 family)
VACQRSNTSIFLSRHTWDRYALPGFVALIWFVILMGFVPDIIHKFRKQGFNYPLAVHIHAAVYVSWLVLLTVQTVLIGRGRVGAHRRLGIFGAGLAVLVVLTGLSATYVVENRMLGTPRADPAFISTLLEDVLVFASLAAAALVLRHDAAAHKRLMLLATTSLLQAGFIRWWGATMYGTFGHGFLGGWMADYLGVTLLVLGIGVYDVVTRRRLHPAYVLGAIWILSWQFTAKWLYVSPWWKLESLHLLGH